jgi:hypothetical protein
MKYIRYDYVVLFLLVPFFVCCSAQSGNELTVTLSESQALAAELRLSPERVVARATDQIRLNLELKNMAKEPMYIGGLQGRPDFRGHPFESFHLAIRQAGTEPFLPDSIAHVYAMGTPITEDEAVTRGLLVLVRPGENYSRQITVPVSDMLGFIKDVKATNAAYELAVFYQVPNTMDIGSAPLRYRKLDPKLMSNIVRIELQP